MGWCDWERVSSYEAPWFMIGFRGGSAEDPEVLEPASPVPSVDAEDDANEEETMVDEENEAGTGVGPAPAGPDPPGEEPIGGVR